MAQLLPVDTFDLIIYGGTGDLAMAYGVPGERDRPKVLAAAEKILAACQKHNVAQARDRGYRAIG